MFFIHIRCDSHPSLVMRTSFQVCLRPCMCTWKTGFYRSSCSCRLRSVTHWAYQPCIYILMPWACQPGTVSTCIVELFSHNVRMCTSVCGWGCICDSYLLHGESRRVQHSILWPCSFGCFWCVRWRRSTQSRWSHTVARNLCLEVAMDYRLLSFK